ncbi:5'-_3' exoribonuclease, putative [Perkinsus marinus ATCC 50983]|uniref:5'->3' exoribonuclease, putative n=1 Tax=Perkinsus marinus (strain ATCC 50983 / TXsc) TaxID=423536 RepID=C5LVR2_PERM5|nr:5'->3' exoribonuclease, putative [Perkinsus marinus ATCC 50983]EEQ99185.1 5'->3' exoribonuclease, putative [Perkinsus marinus ATCC 50983]|eukprot:XP_002766468.1 5'-_3' exoribonuclease, putative [Perkinsus marinus ATCC 50983]
MGVPRFYRWLSERYPLINEVIEPEQIPEFDCLYLDMNGIIHHCSHGDTPDVAKPEDEVWMDIFKYISDLFTHIKPKKLLYMAVDGVAPRAKMNQQRSRRFRTALDAVEATERAVKNGDHPKSIDTFFDSNSITPGTAFMERLTVQLRFFAQKMISENPLWQGVEVVVSGPNVPGEGEHKIMDYIRATKSQPDYDPNTRHCVYGLDADLIMLSLATHEPYVALLREEVIFGPEKTDARALVRPDRLQLLHIYVLREYLALEFGEEDLERVIDDFVLFCMLVGNDFLPHLPYTGVGDGGLERLFSAYKEYREKQISSADPWLVEHGGGINWANFLQYLTVYSSSEEKFLADEVSKGHWQIGSERERILFSPYHTFFNSERRRCGGNGRGGSHMSYEYQLKTGFGYPKSPEEARLQFYKVKGECDDKAEVDELVRDYLEGLQWSYSYYYRGPPSWHWYYRHHYAPFVCTMVNDFDDFVTAGGQIKFDGGGPVTPFQQLMTVLPASSGQRLLPKIFAKLFTSSSSPVKQYYPERFDIDIDGVKVPWGGTTLINFVDEDVLFDAMNAAIAESERTGQDALTEAEKERNVNGGAHVYRYDPSVKPVTVQSTVPRYLQDLTGVTVDVKPFRHPSLPEGMEYFPHWVLPQCDLHKYK